VLGEVISAALRAGLGAFHQVGPRRDTGPHRISVAADPARPGPGECTANGLGGHPADPPAPGQYAFPHAGADERRRLELFAERLDPLTVRRITALGLAPAHGAWKSAAVAAQLRAGCASTSARLAG